MDAAEPTVPVLLAGEPVADLGAAVARGAGEAIVWAREVGFGPVISEITLSGLRGRGGAGFPTGRKWSGIRDAGPGRRFVVCNAAEGEPGTFKDRALIRHNPYQVLEGLAVAMGAVGAEGGYVATKASYQRETDRLRSALEETTGAGWFADAPVSLVLGPDEYLFGEEKGLLEVIEGRDPLPRLFPPYEHGLFATDINTGWEATEPPPGGQGQANPTLVNNVETLANIPHILRHGAQRFRALGTDGSPGTLVATVTGDVEHPLVVEVEMGVTVTELVDLAGGPRGGRVAAVLNGVANSVLTASMLDVSLTYEDMAAIGSGLGSAGFVVYDETACPVAIAQMCSRFLYVESCGQCRSCKFGSGEITRGLEALMAGTASELEVEVIGSRLRSVTDQVRCYLANEEQIVVSSILREFPEEFALHLEGRCSRPERLLPIPKIVDLVDGVVTWDEKQARKQPDWTYSEL